MAWVYLTLEQAIEVHGKTVEFSGGGSTGQLEIGKLDAVLQNIQNDDSCADYAETASPRGSGTGFPDLAHTTPAGAATR